MGHSRRRFPHALALILVAAVLGGCSSWLGEAEAPPLPGERVSVLSLDNRQQPDASIQSLAVLLPRPVANPDWAQSGGNPAHAMQHLALADAPRPIWRVSIGEGSGGGRLLLASPVIAGGRAYVMDAEYQTSALDAATGQRIWRVGLNNSGEKDGAFGGGLAVSDGRLFATTGFAQVVALDIKNGAELWRRNLPGPMRGSATVSGKRVFVVTVDNRLFVLDAASGEIQWDHAGISETAGIVGAGSPAVDGDIVVVPYSSGEMVGLRVENGRRMWSDSLVTVQRAGVPAPLSDVRAGPVIDKDMVLAIGHGGRMVAISLRTGARVWQREIGGTQIPWVAGDFVYLLTSNNELVALRRADGRVRWVRSLPSWDDEKERTGPIVWAGPILAGDRLVVTASTAEAWAISPYSGDYLGRIDLPGPTSMAPVVAGGILYILTDDADLIALR